MNKKILLIDDSKTQLKTFKIMFEHSGYEVETAPDGIEGFQKIFETTPDIIVSDIMMPNLNGYQFCRLVKDNALTKDIPIILLTILEQKIDKFWSNKSGADLFVQKSTSISNIISAIENLTVQKVVTDEMKAKIKQQPFTKNLIQAELNQILDNSLMHSSVLNEFRLLSMHLEDDNIMAKKLFDLLSSVLSFELALLIINPPGSEEVDIYTSHNSDLKNDFLKQAIHKSILKIFNKDKAYNYKTSQNDWLEQPPLTDAIFETTYTHEIKYQNNIVGAICFFAQKEQDIENQKLFSTVLKEINLLITIQSLYAQNKFLSLTDSLTGLYNRRYLMETLEREYLRTQRYDGKLSIAMVDIDFFKKINDTYGHQAGDYVLKEVTSTIKSMLRKNDILFRYGGEEVLIIMPETSKEQAYIPLERIRKYIAEKICVYNDQNINITISIGISDSKQKNNSLESFIEFADKAMYEAKQNGRNQVIIYNE